MSSLEALEFYTYDDYRQWEGNWELIYGVPQAMGPSLLIDHQFLTAQMIVALDEGMQDCPECMVLAEQDWKIDDETVVRPDVVLVCEEEGEAYLTRTPRIVVEVVSPSSVRRDERIKFDLYEREGVPYYLLLYPEDRKGRLFQLEEGKYRKAADIFDVRYRFEWNGCSAEVDFAKVFRRLRERRRKA